MLTKNGLDFLLRITDWFHGHYEDPEWGKRPGTQILFGIALREMANGLTDAELRGQVHAAADKVVVKYSQAKM